MNKMTVTLWCFSISAGVNMMAISVEAYVMAQEVIGIRYKTKSGAQHLVTINTETGWDCAKLFLVGVSMVLFTRTRFQCISVDLC